MAQETDRQINAHFVHKSRISTGEDLLQRAIELDSLLEQSARVHEVLSEQVLVCTGFIRRQGVWQRVSRLNRPLNSEERNYIRRIKRKASSRSQLAAHSHKA